MSALWHVLAAWLVGNAALATAILLEARARRRRRDRGAVIIPFPRPLAPVVPLRPAARR